MQQSCISQDLSTQAMQGSEDADLLKESVIMAKLTNQDRIRLMQCNADQSTSIVGIVPCRVLDLRWASFVQSSAHDLRTALSALSSTSSQIRLVALTSKWALDVYCDSWPLLRATDLARLPFVSREHCDLGEGDELSYQQKQQLRGGVLHNQAMTGGHHSNCPDTQT